MQSDRELTNLIRRKFAIKCTTGYSLNALVDFPAADPVEIVKRLMVGSEGTLGFVSEATYNTVPEWPHKASAFMVFPDVRAACAGASVLRDETAVDAVELFDRASLRECEANEELCGLVDIAGADASAAALLIECRGRTPADLEARIGEVNAALERARLPLGRSAREPRGVADYPFRHAAADFNVFWDVRKGLIPIVGAAREAGTSMLIEDVTCPVDKLPDMMIDLIDMFQRHGYADASCFGHALEGNLHLVFSQGFRDEAEIQRFTDMFEEMCHIVATKHSGSLKGAHRAATPCVRAAAARARAHAPPRMQASTARGATWRRSWRWSGAARRTSSCGTSRASSTPSTSSTPASSSTATPTRTASSSSRRPSRASSSTAA